MTPADMAAAMPPYVALCGVAMYFITKLLPQNLRRWSGTLTAMLLLGAFIVLLSVIIPHAQYLNLSYIGLTGGLLITGIGAIAAWASEGNLDPKGSVHLYYPLFLIALAGAMAIGFATDLFTIFIAVELSAMPVYALCAYRYRQDPAALSAAIKYLMQGVAGTLSALLGVAILFMEGHTMSLSALPNALSLADPSLVMLAAVLILFGYGVKLGIVPLHTWLPDAYAKAPIGITTIMVGPTKIGVLIAIFLSLSAFPAGTGIPYTLGFIITILAVITMTAGNLLALNQRDLRYVLAYSSIAQMGYILLGFGIGLVYNMPFGFTAGLYYAIAYSMMKAGAFLSADAFAYDAGTFETSRMKGEGARRPLLGISFCVFIFGLAGVPFTSGFLGKMLLEQAGMATYNVSGVVFALILALNSALSLGYYVPVISTIIFDEKATLFCVVERQVKKPPLSAISALVFLAVVTVYLGLFPESFNWISHAALELFPKGVV